MIGPSLGSDAIQDASKGAAAGIGLVMLFMFVYYQMGGLVANLAILMNVLFLFAMMALFDATLTLPGLAGIALTVGMSVNSNVLINERIREELRAGKSPRGAVEQGFDRAFSSIFDSQITTFIGGIVLFQYGTGPIRGFAVTLMIGIVSSLFTGVFCSHLLFDWVVRGLRVKQLKVG
jgi:preprotein translocase subunit SecD